MWYLEIAQGFFQRSKRRDLTIFTFISTFNVVTFSILLSRLNDSSSYDAHLLQKLSPTLQEGLSRSILSSPLISDISSQTIVSFPPL